MLTQEVKDPKLFKEERVQEWSEIREQLRIPLVLPVSLNLHLIRHAESKINADKRVTGSQDVELTPRGEVQAAYLGKKLDKHYDLAFTSTLQRSQKTLEIAVKTEEIRVEQIFTDYRLNERGLGVLEGKKARWIPEYAYGDLYYAPEEGENYEKVARRTLSFFIDLAHYARSNEISKVLVSGHMGPMRVMVGILEEVADPVTVLGLSFPNTEVIKLKWKHLVIPKFLDRVC